MRSATNATNGTSPMATTERTIWDGFEVLLLRSSGLEVAVVPELGAKVVSLKNLKTGREWMYRATNPAKLFRNKPGDDFALSPLVGWDECLPTISPCHWRGRALPDHGEVWSASWEIDENAWEQGAIKTSVRLPRSPFKFTRTILAQGDTLSAEYEVVNLSGEPQEFLWAMHPLLALEKGDQLLLPPEIHGHLNHPWIHSLDFSCRTKTCDKAYAGPLRQGLAEILNSVSGDCLSFIWDTMDCDTLGIWLTRGGWNGHHHVALEPANGAPDSLAVAASEWKRCGLLPPFGKKNWSVQIRLSPSTTQESANVSARNDAALPGESSRRSLGTA